MKRGLNALRKVSAPMQGSLTVEASFIVPLILFCMAAIMISGLRQGSSLAQEARAQQAEWVEARENIPELPLVLRGGAEAQEMIDRFRNAG